ncbi:MAG: bifunctional diaminohydroxyphosphoribosylaminopyrimidine deaminase/5-amino-6-(5-phosphoribosylamino)uracil reductase RibD [Chloroflexota bacterium]|nr:bifunctional diaminohydroxyphosphoribosylaminopyrimidine deaminase/5-amino-6-(5-phosphoribosylamino)uracil reductase RibD [Chloroflexota bacterium]
MDQESRDMQFMKEAGRLGRTALGRSSPNPAVGAVIVQGSELVGRGATQPVGKAHAEIMALTDAGPRAAGATLYVTLEPCCHYGWTPPCVDAIIGAGVRRCVIAIQDPFPLVAGKGIARLRAARITVDTGVAASDAMELHAGFLTRVRTGRPLVRAKYAMSLDGHIATRTDESRWITDKASRRHVHVMRDQADAILVGAGTIKADDPLLTTRLPDDLAGYGGVHHPLRIIIDGRGVSPLHSRVFDPALPAHTLVVTTEQARPDWLAALKDRGTDCFVAGSGPRIDLGVMLDLLGDRSVNDVLVEGGGRLLGSFFDAGLVDRVAAFIAPIIIGGADAPGPVSGEGCATLSAAWRLSGVRLTALGDDVLLEGAVAPAPSTTKAA